MRGLWLEDGRARLRSDLESPAPRDGESRVRVLCAGVCATDLALLRGYMGFRGVAGHEFVGLALEGPLAGKRVVGEINAGCGDCQVCAAGDPRHCAARTVLGILNRPGAFADELSLPTRNLHEVPAGVGDEAATFTEPLAAAFQIVAQVEPSAGQAALVMGDGRLGLLCAQVLALHGLEVTLDGRHPERAEILPAGVAYDADPPAQAFDVVVEATGQPQMLARALERVRPRGTVVLKTTAERPAALDWAPVVIHEVSIVGSRCGPFAPALEALAKGRVLVEPMVHARYPLARAAEALEHAARRGVLKVLIQPSE